ncbi:glycoside hydrolase family 28 protein [Trichoderma citrinoviride]|uniref:galacturonan 1,4-alpha-galacturonidase n=1 Tax=Trichoderma citrinoviride TaxID=58853 RepID=A0A2T4AYF4_9HYPO|nr:glycoside hydrolase family 28 protein [Trichoderma citrinoviride]PTB62097.1 glycoside hydrolase family 28 protein [Trichoderma citrinoviride]
MTIHSKLALGVAILAFLEPIDAHKSLVERPNLQWGPKTPGHAFPHSPKRHKTCYVASCNGNDAPAILKAFKRCNKGGTVVLNEEYTIGSPLDLTFLEAVDVAITGTIKFTNDIDFWVKNSFKYDFQNSSAFWRFGGRDVNIYGGGLGLIDGNGQAWYDQFAVEPTLLRPILLVLDGLEHGSWFNLIANSSDILVSDIDIAVKSENQNPAKNGDGWDTFRSDSIVIQDSYVNNSDDCVSFKPNSTNIIVQGMQCNGSHGISVGSLGQYPAEYDIVENIYVYNISMSNASDGARIKVWPGTDTPFEPGLSGGGGAGYVKNVTYDTFYNNNNDWAIEINQCYGQSNQTICDKYPSNMTISDVVFKNMWGTTSKKYDPEVGTLTCSSTDKCVNIAAYNISVANPSGTTPLWICTNMNESLLDIDCVPAAS